MSKRLPPAFRRVFAALLLGAWAIGPAFAADAPPVPPPKPKPGADAQDPARKYADCMELARDEPTKGFDEALAWKGLGGGDAAEHCLAASLMGLKIYGEAAQRFEAIAGHTKRGDQVRTGLLAQAAQGWLLSGDAERAEHVLDAALKLKPEDPDLLIDRAEARAARANYEGALGDLDLAVARAPNRPDAHSFKASALRHLNRPDEARAAAEKALALDPQHVEALLERGILKRMAGDDTGAREDWMTVLRRAPTSAAADAARADLEKMDVKLGK